MSIRSAGNDVMVAEDDMFPILETGQHVDTPDGPGTIIDMALHAGRYGDRIELEPPVVTVELDDEDANPRRIQVCLCRLGLEDGEHEAILSKEFDRLWPPVDDEIPESAHQLVDVDTVEGEEPVKTAKFIRVAGRLYRRALTQKEIDELSAMTDEELDELSPERAHGIVEAVTDDTLRAKKHVKGLEDFFKRLRARRLLALVEDYGDAVLEYETVVLRVTPKMPAKPTGKILRALLEARPELQDVVEEITKAEMEKLKPTKQVLRYRRRDEPVKWKKLPHERMPIEPYREGALPQIKVDVRFWEKLLRDQIAVIDRLRENLEDVATL